MAVHSSMRIPNANPVPQLNSCASVQALPIGRAIVAVMPAPMTTQPINQLRRRHPRRPDFLDFRRDLKGGIYQGPACCSVFAICSALAGVNVLGGPMTVNRIPLSSQMSAVDASPWISNALSPVAS